MNNNTLINLFKNGKALTVAVSVLFFANANAQLSTFFKMG